MTEEVSRPRLIVKKESNIRATASCNGRMTLQAVLGLLVSAREQGVPETSFVDLKFDSKMYSDGNGVTTLNLEWSETASGGQLRLDEEAS
jgi:hypothetical protein|tara:strand:- start:410 stop:679 length:270 start_codon:yes stop_codon:yes gene_type:complete